MRILLVEDEPDLGTAIQKVLSREKYVVDWVSNGTEAWNYLDSPNIHYTLAILDWMLPGLSGVALCQRLRANNSALPVLMLTARDSVDHHRRQLLTQGEAIAIRANVDLSTGPFKPITESGNSSPT
ncbi:MAG: response regulator transcription factor, partial [Acaryochloris sp. SU_5_25]|nr:response regulator transcription factor [Acaryochloris sp. SU_5_25]